MRASIGPDHPLRRLFSGLVEQAFMVEVGLCDPKLTDYLAGLLAEFVHVDQIFRLRTINDEVIRDVARMEAEAALGPGVTDQERRRLLNRYIGDFTLFWTGVYPESLRPRRAYGVDRLAAYVAAGKRSYGIASELTGAADEPPAEVLAQLSDQFEYCVHGLHLVRVGWEQIGRGLATN